jgi:arabinofuranosyltransferase
MNSSSGFPEVSSAPVSAAEEVAPAAEEIPDVGPVPEALAPEAPLLESPPAPAPLPPLAVPIALPAAGSPLVNTPPQTHSEPPGGQSQAARVMGLAVLFFFFLAVVRRGWMCDDAFITMRAVDNLVAGRGFVFNVGERVQGFTNPLWAMVVAIPYSLSREPLVTTVMTSVTTSMVFAALLIFGIARDRRIASLVVILLCFSKAFIDFSTSGLENPMSHLLLLLLVWAFFSEKQSMFKVSLLASLCVVNRFDSLTLVAPIVLATFFNGPSLRKLRPLLWGQTPAIAWFTFAIVYFGFPFPNTAYAKLNTKIPRLEVMAQGVTYLLEVVYNDPMSAALILFAVAAGVSSVKQRARCLVVLCSIVLGAFYVISVGGDFMAGRFITPILTLSALLIVHVGSQWAGNADNLRWASAGSALLILSLPFSPLRDEPSRERQEIPPHGIANERAWYMFLDQVGLTMNIRKKMWQGNGRYQDGKGARTRKEKVAVAGNIGMYGFGAGPKVYVLDPLALTDPLLARTTYPYDSNWRTGHLGRAIPDGYIESIKTDKNVIVNPCIHRYYDKLKTVIRGPLFTKERAKAIFELNQKSGFTVPTCDKDGKPEEPEKADPQEK